MEGPALSFLYLGALLVSIAGLASLDFKHKLALGKSKAYRCLLIISVAFFLVWDLAGIALGIFFRGKCAVTLDPFAGKSDTVQRITC